MPILECLEMILDSIFFLYWKSLSWRRALSSRVVTLSRSRVPEDFELLKRPKI